MSNQPAEEEQEEIEVYEFVATGEKSCERCMALDGSQWREPPNPPHAHCECEVQHKTIGFHKTREDCTDNDVTIESLPMGTVNYGPAGGDFGFEWGFWIEIDCWDGLTHGFEIWVDMGKNSDYPSTDDVFQIMEDFAWSELQDEIEAVMAQVCKPCPDLIVS